jgi:hypothetical protein
MTADGGLDDGRDDDRIKDRKDLQTPAMQDIFDQGK